jgi:HSP20 family protein
MTTVMLWPRRDPFAQVDALIRSAFAVPAQRAVRGSGGFVPATEVVRDGDDAVVRVELPGLDVDRDVTVEIDGARLMVRGERREERTGTHDLHEIRYGSFSRSFALPQHVTAEAVSASYAAGVLTVRVTGAYLNRQVKMIPITQEAADADTATTTTDAVDTEAPTTD